MACAGKTVPASKAIDNTSVRPSFSTSSPEFLLSSLARIWNEFPRCVPLCLDRPAGGAELRPTPGQFPVKKVGIRRQKAQLSLLTGKIDWKASLLLGLRQPRPNGHNTT